MKARQIIELYEASKKLRIRFKVAADMAHLPTELIDRELEDIDKVLAKIEKNVDTESSQA